MAQIKRQEAEGEAEAADDREEIAMAAGRRGDRVHRGPRNGAKIKDFDGQAVISGTIPYIGPKPWLEADTA